MPKLNQPQQREHPWFKKADNAAKAKARREVSGESLRDTSGNFRLPPKAACPACGDIDCAYGECDVTGELCGADYGPCPPVASVPIVILQTCERFSGNCRDEEFCQEGIGVCPDRLSSTSGKACKEAKNNECTIDFCSISED